MPRTEIETEALRAAVRKSIGEKVPNLEDEIARMRAVAKTGQQILEQKQTDKFPNGPESNKR